MPQSSVPGALEGVWSTLFTTASMGGTYHPGVHGAYGRLAAWSAVGGLCGAEHSAGAHAVEHRARRCSWYRFQADSEWFHKRDLRSWHRRAQPPSPRRSRRDGHGLTEPSVTPDSNSAHTVVPTASSSTAQRSASAGTMRRPRPNCSSSLARRASGTRFAPRVRHGDAAAHPEPRRTGPFRRSPRSQPLIVNCRRFTAW
ncbi:DUF6183 family protein [Streptomyces sp. NPDC054783]